MLTVARIELPKSVASRLQAEADFSESFAEFARENLVGFRRPAATAVALIGPIVIAFVYMASGPLSALVTALVFSSAAAVVLGIAAWINWGGIVSDYAARQKARRRAADDLRAGFGEEIALPLAKAPKFYEHEHGVIVLAPAGPWKTIFFDVPGFEGDSRWYLYLNGDLHRRHWRWLRLPTSGAVAQFEATGERLARIGDTPYVEAPEAWEAVQAALGEPEDGAIIPYTFEDAVGLVEARL